MKTVSAGKFKDQCLRIMDSVARTKTPVVVTKRGRPVVQVVPYGEDSPSESLAGSILKETGTVFRTGEEWDADLP
jgi:prevent-host-death family protein